MQPEHLTDPWPTTLKDRQWSDRDGGSLSTGLVRAAGRPVILVSERAGAPT
jgi:hypothetical protein